MRVGIDGTSWTNRRGYGRFARNAVTRLIELDSHTTYVVYLDEQSAPGVELPAGAKPRRVPLRQRPARSGAANSNRGPVDLLRLTLAVRQEHLDVLLFPSVLTYFPVFGVRTVVGIHDAIADDFPELTLPNARARAFWRAKEGLALRLASRLFTVSESSRAALAERFSVPPERFTIVPEAPDPVFYPRLDDQVTSELAALGLRPKDAFFLFAGGISPHKNLETLLNAYAALRHARAELPPLVVAGDLDSDPYLSAARALRAQIARLSLAEHVILPGFVPDETLACLYSVATAVVIPSLAEGFGLPAVEAARCGAPTILSELPAHRETLGDAALYFQPNDVDALAELLSEVLEDDVRRSLGQRGQKAVARLSWDKAAERLRELTIDAATE